MNPRTEVLLRFYEEHAAQARQHEDHRERFTNLLLILCAAAIGLIGSQPDGWLALVAAGTLVILGLFGRLFSLKHYERNRLHATFMKWARDAIDSELGLAPDPELDKLSLGQLRSKAKAMHYQDYPHRDRLAVPPPAWTARRSVHEFWAGIPTLVAMVGVVILVLLLGEKAGLW